MVFLSILVVALAATPTFGSSSSPCGEWIAYKDEKCIKVFHDMLSYEDAVKACHLEAGDASLLSIRSTEEQEFVLNSLFKAENVLETVWLGAKFNQTFKWTDNKGEFHFTNWAAGCPSNSAQKACIQMPSEGAFRGKWFDEPCTKMNRIVCQKPQSWTNGELQQRMVELEKLLEEQRKASQSSERKLQTQIEDLRRNPSVPLGFVYVQLSSQQDPKVLWPAATWTDVTVQYAGLFFRAEGGDAAPFGQVQGENAPRITEARMEYHQNKEASDPSRPHPKGGWWWDHIDFTVGGWSSGIGLLAGYPFEDYPKPERAGYTHHFYTSGGEVRPKNSAIRVWKRTA